MSSKLKKEMRVVLLSVILFLTNSCLSSKRLEIEVSRKLDSDISFPGNGRSPRVWDPARDRGESQPLDNQFGRQTRQGFFVFPYISHLYYVTSIYQFKNEGYVDKWQNKAFNYKNWHWWLIETVALKELNIGVIMSFAPCYWENNALCLFWKRFYFKKLQIRKNYR